MDSYLPPPVEIETLIAALPPHLQTLARRGEVRRYRKNELILREGEHGDTLYILLSGSVKGFSADENEREITYCIDRSGDYFGEMALDGGPRSASVMALEETLCAVVTRHTVWHHGAADAVFARELIERVIGRARFTTEAARSLALVQVYGRLRRFLEEQAGAIKGDEARLVKARLTHLEIANRIGSSREMVGRLMRDLGKGGYVGEADGLLVLLKRLPERW